MRRGTGSYDSYYSSLFMSEPDLFGEDVDRKFWFRHPQARQFSGSSIVNASTITVYPRSWTRL